MLNDAESEVIVTEGAIFARKLTLPDPVYNEVYAERSVSTAVLLIRLLSVMVKVCEAPAAMVYPAPDEDGLVV